MGACQLPDFQIKIMKTFEKSFGACPYCKSVSSNYLFSTTDIFNDAFSLTKCNICHAYFLDPNPTAEQLHRAYDTSYYGSKSEKFTFPLIEKILDYFRSRRAKRVSRLIENKGRVLDVGCGNGRFLKYMLRFGTFELFGTELDGNSAERASKIKEINLRKGFLEPNCYPSGFFDAVTMFHVFEHLANPKEILTIVAGILKPGGIAVFSFPNIASKQARIFKGRWLHLDPPRHLFFFAPAGFINLMKQYGFILLSEKYASAEQNPFGMAQSLLNLWLKKRDVLFESMKGNKDYVKEYNGLNLFMQRCFFFITMPVFIVTDWFASLTKSSATVELTFKKAT